MRIWHVMALSAAAMLLPVATLKAQEAVKVGVCNPAKVFESMDERKVIEDKMKSERDKAQAEVARRKNEVEDIQRQRNELRPESAIFQEKTNQMMEKAVQFEVWARMKQAEMDRTEKEQIKALYEKIRESCKEIAVEKKLDLILAERKPELPTNMEKLTADLAQLYQVSLAPSPTAIANLANNPPTPAMVPNMNYVESIKPTVVDAAGNPLATWGTISAGPNAGLTAEKVLYTLQVNATRPGGANVNMLRNVEVALIPVFQFGVFSDSDLSYFAGPRFDFRGRVHTNGNLYVASGSTLVFYSKVTAAGQIIRDRLANDWPTSSGYGGTVYAANASGGCNTAQPATNCLSFAVPQASWSGGIPSAGAQNPGWFNISTNTYNGFIANNATGVTPLTLPFVGGASMNASATQIQIIRKPPAGESATSPLGASREYNKAEIRVILADTLASLHTDGSASPNPDGQDVWLGGLSVNNIPGTPAGSTSYFAQAQGGYDPNWFPTTGNWNFFDSYLRVEYLNGNTGNWVGVTNEWLGLGFARSLLPRNAAGADVTGHPNAILIFQKRADRNSDGAITPTDKIGRAHV